MILWKVVPLMSIDVLQTFDFHWLWDHFSIQKYLLIKDVSFHQPKYDFAQLNNLQTKELTTNSLKFSSPAASISANVITFTPTSLAAFLASSVTSSIETMRWILKLSSFTPFSSDFAFATWSTITISNSPVSMKKHLFVNTTQCNRSSRSCAGCH